MEGPEPDFIEGEEVIEKILNQLGLWDWFQVSSCQLSVTPTYPFKFAFSYLVNVAT